MKKFKASGILYSNGEHIGLTNFEEAYQVAVDCIGKLTPIKRRRREER